MVMAMMMRKSVAAKMLWRDIENISADNDNSKEFGLS